MICPAIVTGGSAGGAEALSAILSLLPEGFASPILVAQHLHVSDDGAFSRYLARNSRLTVIEPCDKRPVEGGCVYVAPANYHMLVEKEMTISLSVDTKVNWSRPAIDVLFESAARVWGESLVAVILSGANDDGTRGMRAIKAAGGWTIAQEPKEAAMPFMPQAAIDAAVADEVLRAEQIGRRLVELEQQQQQRRRPTRPRQVTELRRSTFRGKS